MRTFAEERSYTVMTGGSMVAGGTGAVVDVVTAVIPGPPVHAHTLVAAVSVVARATILAGVGHQLALVNILCAELTCGRTKGSEDYITKQFCDCYMLKEQ